MPAVRSVSRTPSSAPWENGSSSMTWSRPVSDWAALAGASNLVEPVSVCGQWPSAPGVVARVAPQAASRQPSCGEVREALMAGEGVLPGIVMQEALQTLTRILQPGSGLLVV